VVEPELKKLHRVGVAGGACGRGVMHLGPSRRAAEMCETRARHHEVSRIGVVERCQKPAFGNHPRIVDDLVRQSVFDDFAQCAFFRDRHERQLINARLPREHTQHLPLDRTDAPFPRCQLELDQPHRSTMRESVALR
jgi:hypothetical protein